MLPWNGTTFGCTKGGATRCAESDRSNRYYGVTTVSAVLISLELRFPRWRSTVCYTPLSCHCLGTTITTVVMSTVTRLCRAGVSGIAVSMVPSLRLHTVFVPRVSGTTVSTVPVSTVTQLLQRCHVATLLSPLARSQTGRESHPRGHFLDSVSTSVVQLGKARRSKHVLSFRAAWREVGRVLPLESA